MTRATRTKLTVKQIEAFSGPGVYSDGGGLYLVVTPTGTKNWSFRFQFNGQRREMGVGPFPAVTLASARDRLEDLRRTLKRDAVDPLAAKREAAAEKVRMETERLAKTKTFMDVASEYISVHAAGWSSPKHALQWTSTLKMYAGPVIGSVPVAAIDRETVLRVLTPIWNTKTETATRVRSRIELVLNYAEALGLRPAGQKNPATWRGSFAG